jgi:hypothetical protein
LLPSVPTLLKSGVVKTAGFIQLPVECQTSVAPKLYTRKTINRRAAFLSPLKRAVPGGVIYGTPRND